MGGPDQSWRALVVRWANTPVVWHNPSTRAFVALAVVAVSVALARAVVGVNSQVSVSALLGVVSALVLWFVVRSGQRLSLPELGVWHARRGAVYGLASVAVVYAVVVAAVLVPQVRLAVRLSAPTDFPSSLWLFAAFVTVPLATVLFEELFFRGVLWAYLSRVMSVGKVLVVSSAVFALWHVPALVWTSSAALGELGFAGQLVSTLVVTFVAGVVFGWLRWRSGSLLAPVLAHCATNSAGFVALVVAWSALPSFG